MRWFPIFLLLALVPTLHAQKASTSPVLVRLHAEGKAQEQTFVEKVSLVFPPKDVFIRKVPIISERDFKSFYPFHAGDGTLGAYFSMDADGVHKLTQHCVEARDTMGVIMINQRPACAVMIDKKSEDGIFYVPSGFTPEEITQLMTKFPVMGQEKEFAKKKSFKFPFFGGNKATPTPSPLPQKKP